MKKFSFTQWIGIVVILCSIIIYFPLPNFLSFLKNLAPIIIAIIGIYLIVS